MMSPSVRTVAPEKSIVANLRRCRCGNFIMRRECGRVFCSTPRDEWIFRRQKPKIAVARRRVGLKRAKLVEDKGPIAARRKPGERSGERVAGAGQMSVGQLEQETRAKALDGAARAFEHAHLAALDI